MEILSKTLLTITSQEISFCEECRQKLRIQ